MLMLDDEQRAALWPRVIQTIEKYAAEVSASAVAPEAAAGEIRALLAPFDFAQPLAPLAAVEFAAEGLRRYQVQVSHPRYFGLFNPHPATMGIAADALAAAFNPQLAAWGHSPFAVEVEQHLVRAFGSRFGYDPAQTDGTFTSGGSEANHTALLTALQQAFPAFAHKGARALPAQPIFYLSSEGHHSFLKAARMCGLGTEALREIPANDALQMDTAALQARIHQDRREGFAPFMIVATAGTTSAGVVDPLAEIADVAAREQLWCHVDAAWGGAAVLAPELRAVLAGIERADSITFDAHKWLSVPMGAGLYLTRHPKILERTFKVTAAYIPPQAAGLDLADPLAHSIQWSRRFIGLKVFLALAVASWDGYAAMIRRMTAQGEELRRALEASGWQVVNRTPLPVVCFVDSEHPAGRSDEHLERIVQTVIASGEAWISTTRIGGGQTVLRACIGNYRTETEDVLALVAALNRARAGLKQASR
jgi:glutamate/tyrosine decarboxylase-like PLP-dependent enzyme